MPYLDLPATWVFLSDDGAGDPPLLLLHAWTGESSDWIWQIGAFAPSHRVVAVDLPGFGNAGPVDDFSLPALAELVAGLIDELKLDRPLVVGHSWGGAIACRLAYDRPDAVRAVVSVDGGYRMGDEWRPRIEAFLEQLQGPDAHAVLREIFSPRWHTDASPPHLRAWHQRRIDAVPAAILHDSFAGFTTGTGAMLFRSLSEPILEALTVPVLAFRTTAEEAAWERAHLRHPYSRVELFESAGHWLQQERPDDFNAALAAWIAGLPSG